MDESGEAMKYRRYRTWSNAEQSTGRGCKRVGRFSTFAAREGIAIFEFPRRLSFQAKLTMYRIKGLDSSA
jgi:hypothetical protein